MSEIKKVELNGITMFRTDSANEGIGLIWETEEQAKEAKGMSYAIILNNNEVLREGISLGFVKNNN